MSADTEPGRPSVGLSLILASIGAASLELSICGATHSTGMALARAWGLIAAMLMAFVLLARRRDGRGMRLPHRESLAIGLLATLPFLWHPATSALRGDGVMLETMLLESLRNLGLGLAAFSRRTITTRLAVIVSLFGVMVGSSLVEGTIMTVLAGAFAAMGVVWLLATYWAGLPARLAAAGSRPPLAGAAAALLVVAVVLVFAIVGPTAAATRLAGLVPSSGGGDWPDPDARSGVGDGPNEVDARDSADSVGFTQSEVYLETDKPSLYDAFNETFGEPFKKNKQEKAIALGPNDVQQNREHPAEDNRAGREFSTHRKPPGPRSPASEAADALLYVQGRAPAHLRLVAYDFFDGTSWLPGETGWGNPELHLETPQASWLRIGQNAPPPFLSGRISHRLKVGLLETSSLPTPAHLERFRVGSVNRPDFFEWAQPSVLAMSGRVIPPGTVINTQVRSPRLAALRKVPISEKPGYAVYRHYHPGDCSPAITRLAKSWTQGIPRGWRQVEAVTKALRGHCKYDPSATPPQNCPDLMAHFLLESHRGPDYLFATAAALMLRSLTYPARVVGGFYVNPNQYEPIARHVPIQTENAHLWVEVQLPGGEWVTIEPTPGFDLMPPALSLADQLVETLAACLRWTRRNLATLAFSTLACGILFHRRRQVLDRACTLLWWLVTPRSTSPHVVLSTLRLLERRATWAGRGRHSAQTPTQWCRLVVGSAPQQLQADLQLLVRLAQWSAFAPRPLPESIDARALCRRLVKSCTLSTFHTLAPGFDPEPLVMNDLGPSPIPDADRQAVQALRQTLNIALRGKADVIEHVIACLLARGHLLIEDLPGLGKTTLAKALARVLGGRFARVQCTPDLLPGDITGFRVFDQKTREFEFLPGPVFADVLLADEINRATPRTQSALLEAMAERQVTVDSLRHVLSETFFVIATQNPVEQHGTYPLPEAQLDRFAMKLRIGYPARLDELAMLAAAVGSADDHPPDHNPPIGHGCLRRLQEHVADIAVSPLVAEYLVNLAAATRAHRQVTLGLSPRGLLTWQRLAQACAFLNDRAFTTPDDVQNIARPVLEVRLGIEPEAAARVVSEILESVPVPVYPSKVRSA